MSRRLASYLAQSLPSSASAVANLVTTNIRATVTDVVDTLAPSLTPHLPTFVLRQRSRTENAIIMPPGLVSISRAIYLLERAELADEVEALHDFVVIHFDTDLYEHASIERGFLRDFESAVEDYEEAKTCLGRARREIDRAVGREDGGDDGLMRYALGVAIAEMREREYVVLEELRQREQDQEDLRMIDGADLIGVEDRIWIERMADRTDMLMVEAEDIGEDGGERHRARRRR